MEKKLASLAGLVKIPIWMFERAFGVTVEDFRNGSFEINEQSHSVLLDALVAREESVATWAVLATDVEEIRFAYFSANPFSNARAKIFLKWDALSLKAVKAAITVKEVKDAYLTSPTGGGARLASLQKWCRLITTAEEAREIYNAVPQSDLQSLPESRWNELSLQEVNDAVSLRELTKTYSNAPPHSPAQFAALVKMWQLYSVKGITR